MRITDLERSYVNEVLRNQLRTSYAGTMVRRFEEAFARKIGAKYGVACVNGTATLHTALAAAGVGPGDEVIVPPLTMASTAMAVVQCGATPVWGDINPKTWLLSPDKWPLTKRTKAVIPVTIFGLLDSLVRLDCLKDLFVLEDDAECVEPGMGVFGHAASFSFQSSKHLTAGEGGILLTNDEDLANRMRQFSGLGYASLSAKQGRITKDTIQDPNYARHAMIGYNYRMSDLQAAVLLGQTERMEELLSVRLDAARLYSMAIEGCDWLIPQYVPEGHTHTYWCYPILLSEDAPCSWQEFRRRFIQLGGDPFYAAWRLTYQEPAFGQYKAHCPVAESIQPRLILLKTNYYDEDPLKQAEALRATWRSW
ncbi:MAG: DegT/DnrJ/EryC1/StrS family aminotransferase [Dehalococcoidia bacterium]